MASDSGMCRFASFSNRKCSSRESFTCLKECNSDTTDHLRRTCKITVRVRLRENQLILARVGLFDAALCSVTPHAWQSSQICSAHKDEFGARFRPRRVCSYPDHNPSSKKARTPRGIDLETSHYIFENYKTVVPVGSGEFQIL